MTASWGSTQATRNVAKEEASRKHYDLRTVTHEVFNKTD